MPRFTNTEKTDMVLIYGECHGNSRDALSVYAKRYPNRPKPSRETFRKLVANLRSDGAFQKLVRKPRSNRFAGDERIEERALALVHQNPHTSSRAVAEEVGCSHQTILTIWHKYKFHFSVERFINDPELIHFYTGFKDYTTFKSVFKALEPTAEKMLRWGQVLKATKTEKKEHAPKHERVSLIDQFFMFLIRIRRGWTFKDLAIHFKVSTTTINGMIVTWTNYLFFMLGSIPLWISKKVNHDNMPDVFKKTNLGNTRIIIYIHDLKIRKAVAKKTTVDLYSMEKEYSIFKGLVALSPCGVLVFASSLYPGNMSDREVTIRSGILDMLEPMDEVMLEKDFPIADLLANRRVKLNYPPFIQQYSQHYPTHEKESPEMTLLKAYIHKINQHIKEYQVFDNELNLNLAGTLNQLWAVCCILTNFHGLETCS